MGKNILLIIIVMLLIIFFLLCYILHPPQYKIEDVNKDISIDQPKQNSSSIIGVSTTVMLEPKPKPKPRSPVVPKEELDEVFETEEYDDEDFDHGYDDKVTEEDVEGEDPIFLDEETQTDNDELQKKGCLDYIQIESASRAVVKGCDFTDDNKETLRKLQGTELLSRVLEQMNGKFTDSASDLIDKLGLF